MNSETGQALIISKVDEVLSLQASQVQLEQAKSELIPIQRWEVCCLVHLKTMRIQVFTRKDLPPSISKIVPRLQTTRSLIFNTTIKTKHHHQEIMQQPIRRITSSKVPSLSDPKPPLTSTPNKPSVFSTHLRSQIRSS
jgi:hypothetical protein